MRFHDATGTWFPADLRSAEVSQAVRVADATASVDRTAKKTVAATADFFEVSRYFRAFMTVAVICGMVT